MYGRTLKSRIQNPKRTKILPEKQLDFKGIIPAKRFPAEFLLASSAKLDYFPVA